jgi:putative flippase GtrA
LAIVNNFFWNDTWTFHDLIGGHAGWRRKLRRFAKFNLICGIGLLLNVILLNVQFQSFRHDLPHCDRDRAGNRAELPLQRDARMA